MVIVNKYYCLTKWLCQKRKTLSLTGAGISSHEPVLGSLGQLLQNFQKVFKIFWHVPVTIFCGLLSDGLAGGRVAVAAFAGARFARFWAESSSYLFNVWILSKENQT